METPKSYRSRLVGLSLGVLLALLVWPATRWLVSAQLALAAQVRSSGAVQSYALFDNGPAMRDALQALHQTAIRHPDDYRLQLADALAYPPATGLLTSKVKVERLHELAARFPDRPSVYANLMRFTTQGEVQLYRDEESLLTGDPVPHHKTVQGNPQNTPEQLAMFDAAAAEGERLDPDNAYFPFLRACGLFAAHHDEDALAALRRAAEKSQWHEYYQDEVEGEWQLQEETFGHTGVLPRIGFSAAILFPHLAQLRATSRVAIGLAIEAEQAGRFEEGLAIRDAVRRCGGLLRVQAPSLIGSLVGIAITRITLQRPGGTPLIHSVSTEGDYHAREREARWLEERLRDYDAFLQRIGHPEKRAEVDAEITAGIQVRTLIANNLNRMPFGDTSFARLILLWTAGIVLLSSAFWMLALGGMAALLGSIRCIRSGHGLPRYARRGVALGLIAALPAGMDIVQNTSPILEFHLAIFLISVGLVLMLPGLTKGEKLRSLGVFGLSLAGALLLGSLYVWQMRNGVHPFLQVFSSLISDENGAQSGTPSFPFWPLWIIAALPLLTLVTFGILSLIWRVPLSVGLARGCRGSAVPVACILLLLYGVLVPILVRQEGRTEVGMQRTVQHEGRLMAELSGKPWPGPVH